MTRTELKSFEGQCVEFDGWVERWAHSTADATDVLIKPVKLRPYRLDENHTQHMAHPWTGCDHLWLRAPDGSGYGSMNRLDHIFGYAKVSWYRRADQSVDLGLTAICSASGHAVAEEIQDLLKNGDWSRALRQAQTIHKRIIDSDLAVHDETQCPLQIAADIKSRIIPMIHKNKTTITTTVRRGRSKTPRSFAALITAAQQQRPA